MGNAKAPIRDNILALLCQHPFLSRRQIELYLGCPERTGRQGLRDLELRNWVWQTNARQEGIHTRCIYAPTKAGVEVLAKNANIPLEEYRRRTGFTSERLARIVLTMERVFQLRTLMLWLSIPLGIAGSAISPLQSNVRGGSASSQSRALDSAASRKQAGNSESWRWRAIQWDVEVGKLFSAKGRARWIPFHGAALMQRGDERWAFIVVEFDLSRVHVERDRDRLDQFVASQDDPRYWGKDKEQFFPVLVVIAQDELRLQDYYNLLRSAALVRQLPMPGAYLTTFDAMLSLRDDNALPIWYSTISGRRTTLLADTEGVATPAPDPVPWRKMPLHQSGGGAGVASPRNSSVNASELNASREHGSEITDSLAQMVLNLQPLEKRLLDEIAAHPLLTRKEMILLLQASLRRVQPGLAKLTSLELVQAHEGRFLVAPKGQRYLALTAGFGNAVRRYARARGWGKGFDALLRHWEHTKEENRFFLHLAKVAFDRAYSFTWLSELESRLYYEAGQRRHSFLPDGRGALIAGNARYEFAVEIDRSRSTQERFRRKLAEYEACISSNVLRSEGIELLRLLVVTNSWERADTWRRAAKIVQAHFPIFITTFDRLYASGADAPIWLRGDEFLPESAASSLKVHSFECFAKQKRNR